MTQPDLPDSPSMRTDEEYATGILSGTESAWRRGRRLLGRLPSDPRCKLCASPFGGVAGHVMGWVGKAPWPQNPKYCNACYNEMLKHRAGAEISCSLLFADVRGSTALAEQMRPAEFRAHMQRFLATAARVLVAHDAIVDKFVGDEIIGIFVPALAGEAHAMRAISTGRALLAALEDVDGRPWIPVGVGINSGVAFVGAIGEDEHLEFTAMGDTVNVAARLASAAGAGEILVTLDAAHSAELDESGLERRDLELKGKTDTVSVVVIATGQRPVQAEAAA